jgi:hypothetical protein
MSSSNFRREYSDGIRQYKENIIIIFLLKKIHRTNRPGIYFIFILFAVVYHQLKY